jgi:Co/Zn/Cd efflux system component
MSPEHDHHNNHNHNHNHRPADDEDTIRRRDVLRRLYTATVLCSCFIIVEVIGGLMSGSLAVLSDAAHLFADLASFAVASKFFVLFITL